MARAKKVENQEVQAVENAPETVEVVEQENLEETVAPVTATKSQEIVWLNPASLELDPDQPREKLNEDAIQRYTEMCRNHGLPLEKAVTVVKHPDGKMVVKNGNHRCAAAVAAGLKEIPVILIELSKEDLAPEKMAKLRLEQLLDNLTVPMTPMEEINTIEQAIQDGMLLEEISRLFGISPATIEKNRIIAQAPGSLKNALNNGRITKQAAILLAEMLKEKRISNPKKALSKAMEGKTAKLQIAKLEQYADDVARSNAARQTSLFEKDEKVEKEVKKDKNLICVHGGKPFTVKNGEGMLKSLQNAVGKFVSGPFGNGHAGDMTRVKTVIELEALMKSLAAVQKKLDQVVTAEKAKMVVNA